MRFMRCIQSFFPRAPAHNRVRGPGSLAVAFAEMAFVTAAAIGMD